MKKLNSLKNKLFFIFNTGVLENVIFMLVIILVGIFAPTYYTAVMITLLLAKLIKLEIRFYIFKLRIEEKESANKEEDDS